LPTALAISDVVVVLADKDFLETQIESIVRQSAGVPRLVISCDSDLDYLLCKKYQSESCVVLRSSGDRGIQHNFHNAFLASLALDPPASWFFCSDQDDVWATSKIEAFLHLTSNPSLSCIHSDAVVTNERGDTTATSLWHEEMRVLTASHIHELLLLNWVTGSTSAFRRDVVMGACDNKFPFPLHDVWLTAEALSRGQIGIIHDPLIAYRQHGGNSVGAKHRAGESTFQQIRRSKRTLRYLETISRDRRKLRRELIAAELQIEQPYKFMTSPGFLGVGYMVWAMFLGYQRDSRAKIAFGIGVGEVYSNFQALKNRIPRRLSASFVSKGVND
jgi:hypothetical protein